MKFTTNKVVALVVFVVLAFVLLFSATNLLETVKKGTYHIIQRPITGTISAKMNPGMYWQMFSDVKVWPKSETFYFTFDAEEGKKVDQSIEVRFNDGSLAKISGTARVMLPSSESEAMSLMTDKNFRSYEEVEHKLILPILRNSLRLTANLMTARQSYAEKRADFINYAWDQIQYGKYKTSEVERLSEDPLTGKKTMRMVKIIMKDADGNPIREANPLAGTGILLSNFEVKSFEYEKKVKAQIAQQQENFMAIATAKAEAQKADQDAKTRESKGLADLMEVRYKKLQEKEKAVITAQQEKEVAELGAQKKLEVAKLDAVAAKEEKTANILRGQGESERKKLVIAADGALTQKLATYLAAQEVWAAAYKERKVPAIVMAGSGAAGNQDTSTTDFMKLLTMKAAKDLSLDVSINR